MPFEFILCQYGTFWDEEKRALADLPSQGMGLNEDSRYPKNWKFCWQILTISYRWQPFQKKIAAETSKNDIIWTKTTKCVAYFGKKIENQNWESKRWIWESCETVSDEIWESERKTICFINVVFYSTMLFVQSVEKEVERGEWVWSMWDSSRWNMRKHKHMHKLELELLIDFEPIFLIKAEV